MDARFTPLVIFHNFDAFLEFLKVGYFPTSTNIIYTLFVTVKLYKLKGRVAQDILIPCQDLPPQDIYSAFDGRVTIAPALREAIPVQINCTTPR